MHAYNIISTPLTMHNIKKISFILILSNIMHCIQAWRFVVLCTITHLAMHIGMYYDNNITHISGSWMLGITNTGSIETWGWYSSASDDYEKIHYHHKYYDSKQNPVFRYLQEFKIHRARMCTDNYDVTVINLSKLISFLFTIINCLIFYLFLFI